MGILGWSSWPRPVAVAVDAQYRSELRDEVYIALIVEPGMHEVLADALPPYRYVEYGTALRIAPERRRPASFKIEALPGSTYFIELVCTSGTGTIETSLRLIPDADALPIIRQLHAAW